MDQSMQFRHLAQAERHIALGIQHISDQELRIAEFDVRGQQIFEAEAVNGVGVASANLHETIMTPGIREAADFVGGSGDALRLAKFVYKFHTHAGASPNP